MCLMINYQGLSIESVEENRIKFLLSSHNVMGLSIFFEQGTGYKEGDKIEVSISNEGCTNWEVAIAPNAFHDDYQVRMAFDGWSESQMTTTIFSLTGLVLQYCRDSISMQQIAAIIKNRISEQNY